MQKLFHWHSFFMKDFNLGDIVVMAETVEDARGKARQGFEPAFFSRPYTPRSHEEMDAEDREEFAQARKVFDADIAKEPKELPGFIFIMGSN